MWSGGWPSMRGTLALTGSAVSVAWQAVNDSVGAGAVPEWVDLGVSVLAVGMLGWLIRLIATGAILPRSAIDEIVELHAAHIVERWQETGRR